MNNNQQPQFTIVELGAKFGAQLAQNFGECITLEKIVTSQRLQIEAMTKNETSLVDHIQTLEAELSELKKSLETIMADPYHEFGYESDAKIAAEGIARLSNKKPPRRTADQPSTPSEGYL